MTGQGTRGASRQAQFRVWAPGHRSVEVLWGGSRHQMAPAGGGWWLSRGAAGPGTRYQFSLDGGPLRPDPRSRYQPEGIDGPSETVDTTAWIWHDSHWRGARLASSVLYELHVGTFSPEGTFDGAAGRLDHLCDLGVDAVEVMPVAEASGERGWGYDGVGLWAPHHAYGGPEGFQRLVDACHVRGLAVVLDVVYNHLGPAGNYLAEFGPYFTDRYRTPWGQAVNFDGPGSDGVRRFVVDNALMWLDEYHVDGLRLDAVHAIHDESALHILEELAVSVEALADRLGRQLWLIAESDRNDPRLVKSREAGGYGLSASWSDDFHHALHSALSGERSGYYADFGRLDQVARALRHVYVYGRDWSPFRQRHHGRPVGDLPATRFVGYLQNHDQIGNRATGERSAALMSPGRLKAAAALVLLGPFVPMLFQGEEWAASTPFQYFTDHREPELGRAVSEGRREEFAAFGWSPDEVPDPQDPETYLRSRLDWSEPARGLHADLLEWHRRLIAIRRAYGEVTDGRLEAVHAEAVDEARTLVLRRGRLTVLVNLGGGSARLEVPAASELLLSSAAGVALEDTTVTLPADSVAVLATGTPPPEA